MHKLYSYLIKLSCTAAHVCMLLVETDIKPVRFVLLYNKFAQLNWCHGSSP